jgi:hypothetical protein
VPLTVVPEVPDDDHDSTATPASPSLIDQIVREGARKMLAAALPAQSASRLLVLEPERSPRK